MITLWLNNSIRQRLFFTTLPLLAFFLLLTGLALDRAYQHSVSDAEFQKLQLQVWSLMTDAEVQLGKLMMPDALQEPRFSQPESDLYGFVIDAKNQKQWQSISVELTDTGVAHLDGYLQSIRAGHSDKQKLASGEFIFRQGVTYVNENNDNNNITFVVVELGREYQRQLGDYRRNMVFWLVAVLVSLLLVQTVALNWGLSPLVRLAADVRDLEAGSKRQLDGSYPKELHPITENLNHLIVTQQNQQERYRHTLSDLAHSLKTPLAVLRSTLELSSGSEKNKLLMQIETMDRIVSHQLKRVVNGQSPGGATAHVAAKGKPLGNQPVPVKPVISRVCTALATIYVEKNPSVTIEVDDALAVGLDETDFMEVVGNIIDNAFKYSRSLVVIKARLNEERRFILMTVEDDGQGIPLEQREQVTKRGIRLDSSQPGQGIGMTVAQEIIDAYGGDMAIEYSEHGGARICLTIPVG